MGKTNRVFIARSLDGYIADRHGGIDWLEMVPNPEGMDLGYQAFISGIDAILMGRRTFEVVCSFKIPWPYQVPVFVLSQSLNTLPEGFQNKAELVKGSPVKVLDQIHQKGYFHLYIDGGHTIQSFLEADLIDEMIISTLPVLLGGGAPLFADLPAPLEFEHVKSRVLLGAIVQDHYKRKRNPA